MGGPIRCGVLGDPIGHSLSPALHNAGYAALGEPWSTEWAYEAVQVPSGGLAEFLDGLDDDWRGLSLTMPLKREALPLAATVSDWARMAGAANTLVRRADGGWDGDNTDLPGAIAAVRQRYDGEIARGVVLGGGATAASTGLALIELGATSVTLLVREEARAVETLRVLRSHPASVAVTVLSLDARPKADVVVSTIPVAAQTPELVAAWAHAPVLFDVLYDPWPTPLGRAATGTLVSGLDLLVHQAVVQFELFTGRSAPLAAMRAAGEDALMARGRR